MIFTPIPGEFIGSALIRGNEISGFGRIRQADFCIPSGKTFGTAFEAPPSFGFLSYLSTKDRARVLYKHTLYPIVSIFGFVHGTFNITPNQAWKICTICIQQDIDEHGSAYIHTAHLLSSTQHCHRHDTTLREHCPCCYKNVRSHAIGDYYNCAKSFKHSYDANQVSINYSRFIHEAITSQAIPHNFPKVIELETKLALLRANKTFEKEPRKDRAIRLYQETFGAQSKLPSYNIRRPEYIALEAYLAFGKIENLINRFEKSYFNFSERSACSVQGLIDNIA